jgi:hypothetical protein
MNVKDSNTMSKYISKVYWAIAVLIATSACTKEFDQMNVNPNALTTAPYSAILTNSIITAARNCSRITYEDGWARYHVRDVYVQNDQYQFDGSLTSFSDYSSRLKNLQLIMKNADAVGDVNSVAAAKILTAYSYQCITDRFGDIPYSEALQADANPSVKYPKYDSQQSIYMDLIVQLKAANSMINLIKASPAGDLLFSGDMMKWKRFANSLLLRVYNRMSIVDPVTAKAGIEEIMGNPSKFPIISSNAQNVNMQWIPGNATYRSPYWVDPKLYASQEKVISKQIVDFLTVRNDTRLAVYARPATSSGKYAGLELGAVGGSTPNLSLLGVTYFMSEDTPTRIIQYSEILFIIAEAALNKWNVGMAAKDAYEAAVRASFEQYGLTLPNGYFSNPLNDFNGSTPQMELIGDQKWLALFPDGVQGWAEVRRTGYPVYVANTEPIGTVFPGLGVIKRYPYPNSEATDNPEGLKAALAAQPGIVQTKFGKGVWWDVK